MNCWISVIDIMDWPLNTSTLNEENNTNTVYPNPITDNRFTTQFEMKEAGHVRFELYDMSGKLVYKIMDTYVKKGKNEYSISTSELSKGLYIFKVNSDQGTIASHKITVE
jgi:hypothetical protein